VVNTSSDLNEFASWYASPQTGGSPGVEASAPCSDRTIFYKRLGVRYRCAAATTRRSPRDKIAMRPADGGADELLEF